MGHSRHCEVGCSAKIKFTTELCLENYSLHIQYYCCGPGYGLPLAVSTTHFILAFALSTYRLKFCPVFLLETPPCTSLAHDDMIVMYETRQLMSWNHLFINCHDILERSSFLVLILDISYDAAQEWKNIRTVPVWKCIARVFISDTSVKHTSHRAPSKTSAISAKYFTFDILFPQKGHLL